MAESTPLFVGLDVHKDSIAVAHAQGQSADPPVFVGAIGPRQADLDKLIRRLQAKTPTLIFAYEAGPCGYTLHRWRSPAPAAARERRGRRLVKRLLGGPPNATLFRMTIRARVNAGRLVVDEPTDLPDGTELELLPLDPGDWLDEANRAALHKALRESDADVGAGRLIDADDILKELRSR